jgi:hypothetical protein
MRFKASNARKLSAPHMSRGFTMRRRSMGFVRGSIALLALMLAGCSVPGGVVDWMSEDSAGAEPINYRYVVAASLDGIVGVKEPELRVLEISPPRRVDVVKGAAWLVCLKSLRNSLRLPPAYYGIVIQREKMSESRIAVGTDGCETQSYTPFDWNLEKTRPVLR